MNQLSTPPDLKVQFDRASIDRLLAEAGIDFSRLNIEELWRLISSIEKNLGIKYQRMDFGVPGLPPPELALNAQMKALAYGAVAASYPPYDGVAELKLAAARFVQKFLGIDVEPECCIVTCGSTHGSFIAQAVAGRRYQNKDTMLFLDPGYPPMRAQAKFLGLKCQGIDLYHHRGQQLIETVTQVTNSGNIAAICWSSPNNPTWNVLTDKELCGVAEICGRKDIIAIEDATYLGMDFRYKFNTEMAISFPPSIAHHTDNYFLLLSASKMFSYAGERVGLLITSRSMMNRSYEGLEETFGTSTVRRAINKGVFNVTAGAPHSAQLGIAALLEAISNGEYNLTETLFEYGRRAQAIKDILLRNGFHLIYESDISAPVQNGFYFTFGYPGFSGVELLKELLYYGLTALPLSLFGSCRIDGLRACVALVRTDDLPYFEEIVRCFRKDH